MRLEKPTRHRLSGWTYGYEIGCFPPTTSLHNHAPFGDILPGDLRWDPAKDERLNQLAMDTGRNTECHLRELVEQGMDDPEDAYLGAAALEANRRSGKATISLDQVIRNLGL